MSEAEWWAGWMELHDSLDSKREDKMKNEIIWPVTACEDDCTAWEAEFAGACDCGAKEAREWIADLKGRFAALEQERDEPFCDETGEQAKNGECPVHHGDACLIVGGFAATEQRRLRAAIREVLERGCRMPWCDIHAYLTDALTPKGEHEPGCPRLQFWDAGEHEAPCTCGDGECRCNLRTKLVGDGCSVCNPTLAAELTERENDGQR